MKILLRREPAVAAGAALVIALSWLPGAAPAVGQDAPGRQAMTIVDLIDVPSLSDPQLSSDGDEIAFVRSDADWDENGTVSHVWRVGADGRDLVQLTNGEHGESSPRWAPDGSRIAFVARRGDDSVSQLYVIPNDGGEALRLTDHPTSVSRIAWSPDGRWIYFVAPEDKTEAEKAREKVHDNVYAFDESWKHRHLWRVPAAGGDSERVTEGDLTIGSFDFSRDGSWIVHQRAPSPRLDDGPLAELWLMRADGGDARRLTNNEIGEAGAELSPDGQRVLFVANSNEDFDFYYNDKIFTVPATGGTPEVLLPEFPHEISAAHWSRDGGSIYFLANTGVRQELFRVRGDGRNVQQLTDDDHVVGSWSYDPKLDRHAFVATSPTAAPDVWTMDDGARTRQVTTIGRDLADRYRLPRAEVVRWKGEDGVEVEGILYYPLDYTEGQRYPLVVQTHGGPAASDKLGWFSSNNYVPVLAARGFAVLQPNYRGSTGYGDEFLRDMVGHYFNQAHKDVLAGVDYLIARGIADGERMAKMGWSAGGHMTNKMITYTDRFKAASSGAGAVDWVSMYAQSDTRVYRTPWFGGTPWEEDAPLERYLADSPLTEIYKARTPTLIFVGEADERVPMPQSIELYRALRANDVPTHLYVAPGQGHGWRELQQRLFKVNAELDWFEHYVRDRNYTWELSPVHPQRRAAANQ